MSSVVLGFEQLDIESVSTAWPAVCLHGTPVAETADGQPAALPAPANSVLVCPITSCGPRLCGLLSCSPCDSQQCFQHLEKIIRG